MKLKIDDLYLDNSHVSMNLERRLVVTIPYQNKYYLLISEMNLTFKENNPKNYGIQNEKDVELASDEIILTKEFTNEQSLFIEFQKLVVDCLENIDENKWINFCKEKYTKKQKEWTEDKQNREKNRFLNFNKSVLEKWKSLSREDFILGDNQYLDEWNVFWKYFEMQKLSEKLNYKEVISVKPRKI